MNYSVMKKIILLAATLFSLSFFGNAQSLDKALERLEKVRSQKGEQSQEYLTALDTVIWAASMTGDNSMAISYRQQHLDIVRRLKGENCFEVADDIWRLGNASFMLGDSIGGCDYYAQASEIFDKVFSIEHNISDEYLSHYSNCLYRTYTYYYAKPDIEAFTNTVKKYERIRDKMRAFNPCYNIITLYHFSYSYEFLGDQKNAEHYSHMVVESCSSIDSCNYQAVLGAFMFLTNYYYETRQNELLIDAALLRYELLDSSHCFLPDEKIWALYYLSALYDNDIEMAISYGKHAEQLLIDKHASNEELYNDQVYYKVVNLLALKHFIKADYVSGMTYYQRVCNILEHNNMMDSKEYYDALTYLVHCAYNAGEYAFVIKNAPKLEPMVFSYSDTPIEDAYLYVAYMGDAKAKSGDYKEAIYYYDEAMELLPQLLSGSPLIVSQIQALVARAEALNMAGEKGDAITCLTEAKGKLEKLDESADTMSLKAQILSIEGQIVPVFQDAMACFDSALLLNQSLLANAQLEPDNDYDIHTLKYRQGVFLLNKGMIQFYNGVATDALNAFTTSASIFQELHSQNSAEYIACQNNIAMCQMNLGNYSDAINILNLLLEIVEDNYGTNNPYYAMCLQNYSVYYQCNGQPDKALQYCMEAAIVNKTVFGEESERYGQIVAAIGHMYLANQMPNEALHYLSEGLSIIDKNGGTSSYVYCHILSSLAIASFKLGHVGDGFKYYDKVEPIIDSIYGPVSQEHANLALSMGWEALNYEKGGDFAFDRLLDAAGTYLTIGQTYRPEYINSLIGYAVAGLVYDKPIANDYIELTTNAVASYYETNVAFYSSTDRQIIWNTLSNIKNTIIGTGTNDNADIHLYNYLLFSKSLMLSASESFKDAIFKNGQKDLIDRYNDIQAAQRVIDMQSFGLSPESLSVDLLYERKTSMERNLMAQMKAMGYSVNDSLTYNDVRKTLNDNEIAIEFVDFYHLKDKKTYYVALLAKSSWDKPVYVQLCTEEELKACLGNPNITYSTDDLYSLLWQPLAEYINEGDKVYFSPSGMLLTIALESLHTPDGSYLNDKYNLVRLTSTRELCKESQPKAYKTGAVYGGLQYDVDQQRMTEVAAMNKTASEDSPVFALRGEDRGNWNYLLGTRDEAEHIAGIMQQANIGYNLYEGDLGSEESFKALSGGHTDIIHLATHGYFIEGEKADMNDFMNSLSPLARQKTDSVIDPLLRSGLILSGGNSAWLGKEVPEGIEDGVLTALEISTMNLSGTDMVVMSACETGLGDITSDGVFGLQRAFKMAGVQTLVMSLWKVDDNATSLMMQTFYEHLLSGMSKREAFNLARVAVRAKYTEPYYWAGFIMLD